MSERYNGWTNRETWALNLWLNNDESLQAEVVETLATAADDLEPSKAAEALQEYVKALLDRSVYLDTFGVDQPLELSRMASEVGSLWRVDWREVAEAFLEAFQEATA